MHDELRQGALRYTDESGAYLSGSGRGVPRAVELLALLDLTDRALRDPGLDSDLRDLVDAGGSLGGARPKAAVRDHTGTLMIAMTLLGVGERTHGLSFAELAELAEVLAAVSADPGADLHQLYRRALLGALVSNSDNHARNHGFLQAGTGWMLSPAFDMNPDPDRTTPAMPIVPGGGDLVDTIEVADAFRLTQAREVALMRSAFETELTDRARRLLGR